MAERRLLLLRSPAREVADFGFLGGEGFASLVDQLIHLPVLAFELFVELAGFPEIEGQISSRVVRVANQFGPKKAFPLSKEFGPLSVRPVGAFEAAAVAGIDSKLPNNHEPGLGSGLASATGLYGHFESLAI